MRWSRYIYIGVFLATACVDLKPLKENRDIGDEEYRQSIRLDHGDSIIVLQLASRQDLTTIDAATYYWFQQRRIYSSMGNYAGNLLDREYLEYFPDGSLKTKGRFDLGLKEGKWYQWHRNGKLSSTMSFTQGRRDGDFAQYDPKGRVLQRGSFDEGLLDGNIEYLSVRDTLILSYKKGAVVDTLKSSGI
ncbi:MAG: hypothetical protein AAGA85_22915 [Bacteroidota bacterium]